MLAEVVSFGDGAAIVEAVEQRHQGSDVIRRGLAVLVAWKEIRITGRQAHVVEFGRVTIDALLKQRTFRTRVDDGCAEPPQVVERLLDDLDAFLVRDREQRAVHVLADHADMERKEYQSEHPIELIVYLERQVAVWLLNTWSDSVDRLAGSA